MGRAEVCPVKRMRRHHGASSRRHQLGCAWLYSSVVDWYTGMVMAWSPFANSNDAAKTYAGGKVSTKDLPTVLAMATGTDLIESDPSTGVPMLFFSPTSAHMPGW
jgi:hypothetical protein